MNLFDKLVDEALMNRPELSQLRIVVEKELLHHDILRILNHHHLLNDLVFMGGTALRSCYGGVRLSEDLDFTGGSDFSRDDLSSMSRVLIQNLNEKYGLEVTVSEPFKDKKNVDTWKIKIQTRPESSDLPAQRIHLDICSVPSYEKQPILLLNPYDIEMGTSGLIIQTQSREEIYTDNLLAFALRPNRIKSRDLWDMVWLHQKGLTPRYELIEPKLKDRGIALAYFFKLYHDRVELMAQDETVAIAFKKEMKRFLPFQMIDEYIEKDHFWSFMVHLVTDLGRGASHALGK